MRTAKSAIQTPEERASTTQAVSKTSAALAASGASARTGGTQTWRKQEDVAAYLMMAPALLPFLVFSLIPLGWVVYVSFNHYNGFSTPTWAGLDNYANVFQDSAWWKSVGNTFIFATGKLIIEIPLALVLAVILNQKIVGSSIFRAIFFLPSVTSIAVMSVIFVFIFRPYQGILNGILQSLHLIPRPLDYLGQPASAMLSVIGVGIWQGFGINTVLFLAGLQTIPKDVYESAAIDGANPLQKLWYVTIPMLGPSLRIVVLLALVFTLRSFDVVKVLTDGEPFGSTEVMFTYIFNYFFVQNIGAQQYGYGAALGVVAAILIAAIALVYNLWTRKLQGN